MDIDDSTTQTDDSDVLPNNFNTIIGYIEDIVISDSFQVSNLSILTLNYISIWWFLFVGNSNKLFGWELCAFHQWRGE